MENTIFIQNLHKDIDAAVLCDEFRSYGRILSVKIECDDDMKSIREGYITFGDYVSALNSIKFMNGRRIKNKAVNVSFEVEKEHFKQVFVKNFSPDYDECDLLKVFEKIGIVEQAKISEDDNGRSNGYGFVVFKTHTSAKKAVEQFNGKILNGQKLIVQRYKRKSERDNLIMNSMEHAEVMLKNCTQKNNLFIKNLPKDMKDKDLKLLVEKYGDVLSVKIARDDFGVNKGFGFASFKRNEDAERALRRLNGIVLNGKKLEVNFKQDRDARKHYIELKDKEREGKINHYRHRSQSTSALQFLPHKMTTRTLMKI